MTSELPDSDQITLLLQRMRQGDDAARRALTSLVYPQLKRIAAKHMIRERANHTLQPTELVHEVFLRLAGGTPAAWQNRKHFFALSAELMHQILVDHARRRSATKRGGGAVMLEIQDWQARVEERPELVLDIDRLISRLRTFDERQAQVVQLRYFAGLTEDEIAEVLGLSARTIKRDWVMARAWMRKELSA